MSQYRLNDKVLIDGKWWKVVENWKHKDTLCVESPSRSYDVRPIREIEHLIEAHEKYVPKIRYNGAVADMESYIKDGGTLVYLECVGQEYMVKSITSVLMQGRVRMNDHAVDASFGFFDINKAGNKRKMVSLDDGVAHAILYHSPSISDVGFNILIGRSKEELLLSFASWLEKSQPLPYPKHLTHKIYEKLQDRSKIIALQTFNIEAVKIDLTILEDEYNDIQEMILEVCKENSLISPDAVPLKSKAPLPKSPYLTEAQVKRIFDTLDKMPKTYELDGVDIKPVGLKLFGPNFNLYVVEADKGSYEDEFESMHTQCFGYVENLSAPECSEWGYINIPYYLEVGVKVPAIGTKGGLVVGFEQDLYFEDRYITQSGKILTKEEMEHLK
jgi:hypothetical protein